jgi:hypothetical protein
MLFALQTLKMTDWDDVAEYVSENLMNFEEISAKQCCKNEKDLKSSPKIQ